ncbi:RNA polymerase sigma factor [Dyadobacter fermentans]|uniref:RNA polymerase, sigma-24 subunit, ECF subfamily n=1 Tax=Dyadobacter fermentans (strain ATCC 700827 / DSM 18053 / CIP 107007 / KCTC 52180 / NS114) TaxID=471854 RepID=C6W663_DYAFD|nr:sigma-70 family RNA polymerase sigma factor [Dyadobacter fermentans]ACT92543.1 RNA polymerase, sigma-24 subunit, ECF subfamily [Dyadobacter fermentans DSM 18053]
MSLFRNKKYSSLADLVRACQTGDTRAQTAFYERYKSRLLGLCLRYAKTKAEAEDIFQEGFIKVFKNINELRNVEVIDSWVKSVVIRTAINYYHRTTKEQQLHSNLDDYQREIDSGDYGRVITQMDMNVLLNIISTLPDGYRMIINLHLVDGYTHTEIGEMLGISDSTSRSQFLRGRNLLMKKLQEKGITQYEIF